jgi:hypothetical protein
MDKIKKIEKMLISEIFNSKDKLINFGVELEDFHFEFEPRYIKLLESLENHSKICLDKYPIEFMLLIPSLINRQLCFSLRFLPTWREFIVTTSTDVVEDYKEPKQPYLYIFIPTFSGIFEKDVLPYLLPDDLFYLEDGYITLKFRPQVKYREFII